MVMIYVLILRHRLINAMTPRQYSTFWHFVPSIPFPSRILKITFADRPPIYNRQSIGNTFTNSSQPYQFLLHFSISVKKVLKLITKFWHDFILIWIVDIGQNHLPSYWAMPAIPCTVIFWHFHLAVCLLCPSLAGDPTEFFVVQSTVNHGRRTGLGRFNFMELHPRGVVRQQPWVFPWPKMILIVSVAWIVPIIRIKHQVHRLRHRGTIPGGGGSESKVVVGPPS